MIVVFLCGNVTEDLIRLQLTRSRGSNLEIEAIERCNEVSKARGRNNEEFKILRKRRS